MSVDGPNYTQIPNLLIDDLLPLMSEAEMRVTLALTRRTFGYYCHRVAISLTDLQEATRLSRQGVINGINAGIARGTIMRTAGKRGGFVYELVIDNATQTCVACDNATQACVACNDATQTWVACNDKHPSTDQPNGLVNQTDYSTSQRNGQEVANQYAIEETRGEQLYATPPSGDVQAWNRLPDEPAKWYSRFEIYRSIGPERNIHMAYLKVWQHRNGPLADNWMPPTGAYRAWTKVARTWNWIERAEAWDEFCRQNLSLRNEQRRTQERETRIQIITQQLHIADIALLAAQLDTLTVDQARRLLPTIRLLLRDMLDQHRINLEAPPTYDNPEERELIPFTADELAALTRDLPKSISGNWNSD